MALTGHLSVGGYENTSYKLSTASLIVNDWVRTVGSTGWYNQTHGGGWYMKDNNYIRNFGSKAVLVEGANLYVGSTSYYFTTAGAINASKVNLGSSYYFDNSGNIAASNIVAPRGQFENVVVAKTIKSFEWDITHIANLGGDFLVTPTIIFKSGNVSISNLNKGTDGETITMTINDISSKPVLNTNTIGGAQWLNGAKIKISGEIGGVVLGTCDGSITADVNTSSKTLSVSFKYSGSDWAKIPSGTTVSADSVQGLTVMLTEIVATSGATTTYPVGIYLTSYEKNAWPSNDSKAKPSISVYGGTSTDGSTPKARIGSMAGLPAVNGVTPSGWGIYTNNGYFSGVIVSTEGKIGGWSLDESSIYSGTHSAWNTAVSGLFLGNTRISGGSGGTWYLDQAGTGKIGRWTFASNGELYTTVSNNTAGMGNGTYAFWAGAASASAANAPFSVTYAGALKASSGNIAGFSIGASAITKTKTSYSETTNDGVYLGTDGIGLGKGKFYVTSAGALTATSATITGAINATSGTIGSNSTTGNRWQIGDKAIYNKTDSITSTAAGTYVGVDGIRNYKDANTFVNIQNGVITAKAVNLTGTITATAGTIGGCSISNGVLQVGSANVANITVGALSDGANYATTAYVDASDAKARPFVVGTQTSATGTWVGTCSELTSLEDGQEILYFLPVAGSGNATLNLTLANGSTTGAVNCYFQGASRLTTHFGAGMTIPLVYRKNLTISGTSYTGWWTLSQYNTNTVGTYGGVVTAGTNSSGSSANTVFPYTLVMKKTYGSSPTWVSLVTSSSNGTSKARYTGGLYPDKIMYMSAGSTYASNANTGECYNSYSIDLRYSTNCGTTLTAGKPVYLVGTMSNGLFYLDATWWTQTPPTSVNNKYYIYLGVAANTYIIRLQDENPIMMYHDGEFKTVEYAKADDAAKTASSYITYVSATDGIKVHNAGDLTDYVQINSDYISMWRNNSERMRITDSDITLGNTGTNEYNTYITTTGFQVRKGTTALSGFTGDSIWLGNSSNFSVDSSGKLTANNASISGGITATSGAIGGFKIDSTSIRTNDVAVTSNADNSIALSSADFTRTINSTSRAGLRFAIGDKFGVTGDGAIFASSATISGAITANTGYIGGTSGWTIASQQLSNGTIGADNSMFLGTKNLGSNTSIAGRSGSDWRLTVGSKFGVTNTGAIYSTGGKIGGWDILASRIESDATGSSGLRSGIQNTTTYSASSSVFYAGCSTAAGGNITGKSNFYVTQAGNLYANMAYLGYDSYVTYGVDDPNINGALYAKLAYLGYEGASSDHTYARVNNNGLAVRVMSDGSGNGYTPETVATLYGSVAWSMGNPRATGVLNLGGATLSGTYASDESLYKLTTNATFNTLRADVLHVGGNKPIAVRIIKKTNQTIGAAGASSSNNYVGTGKTFTFNANPPSGYSVLGVTVIYTNHMAACKIGGFYTDADAGTITVSLINTSSTSFTDLQINIRAVYVKSGALSVMAEATG